MNEIFYSTVDTLDAWTGKGKYGFYKLLFKLDFFKWRFCLWKRPN